MGEGITYNFNSSGGSGDTYAQLFTDTAATNQVAVDDDGAGALQFSLSYTAPTSGVYYLRVKTFTSGEAAAYSLNYARTSPNAVPNVQITSPTNGAVYLSPANVVLSADADDTDGEVTHVEFYANSTLLGTATNAPYSLDWDVSAEGAYVIEARAYDDLGGMSTSATVTITNTVPTLAVGTNAIAQIITEGSNGTNQSFEIWERRAGGAYLYG